ncbi:MAG: Na Ca ex protein [Dehalococcoidia bacterium]|nr:Na Ca ex protein [Dehalococcoidia bacterium]
MLIDTVEPLRASPERIIRDLSNVDMLRALPPEEVQAIVPYVRRQRFSAGQRIFAQGEVGDALYLVDQGLVRVILDGQTELARLGPGEAFGEMALLTGEPRSATVIAETDLAVWRISREDFQQLLISSPALELAVRALEERRRRGVEIDQAALYTASTWKSRALRSLAAHQRGLQPWQIVMGFGFMLWAALFANERGGWLHGAAFEGVIAGIELLAGLTIIQGACEAFIQGVERVGARLRWDGFISGTIGETVATLPEFVVIAFLVQVEPLAAFVTAVVTVFNNSLAFSIYSFFLPKDHKGSFVMPPSLAKAGGEVLVAGSGIALVVGSVMLMLRAESHKTALVGADLVIVGAVMLLVFGYYMYTLVRYYAEGDEQDHTGHPPNPHEMGHDTSWRGIAIMFLLGLAGSFFGGESIGAFADTALNHMGLPTIPTAAALAFFAGISEYIIIWKSHRRGELGIALSSAFGGMTQVMFLLVPFSMLVIAIFGFTTGGTIYTIPITMATTMLILLLFPLFYVLLQYLEDDHTLSNLDAAAMTGIYVLLLYFLFTAPPA